MIFLGYLLGIPISSFLVPQVGRNKRNSGSPQITRTFPGGAAPSVPLRYQRLKLGIEHMWTSSYLRSPGSAQPGRREALDSSLPLHLRKPGSKRPNLRPRGSVRSRRRAGLKRHMPRDSALFLRLRPHPPSVAAAGFLLTSLQWTRLFLF